MEQGVNNFNTYIQKIEKHPLLTLIFTSLFLTLFFGSICYKLGLIYNENHSYFFDAVSYSYTNAKLSVLLETQNHWSLGVSEWLHNNRQPFRMLYMLFFFPFLLGSEMGHLAFTLPILFLFLSLLGWTVFKRTQSLIYSLATLLFFFSIKGLFSSHYGLIPNWLDAPSALLCGAGAFCLINAFEEKGYKWITGFALLISLSFLSRFPAGFYATFMCGPVFLIYLYDRFKKYPSNPSYLWKPLILSISITGILCSYFAIAHGKNVLEFYRVYGYALNHGTPAAIEFGTKVISRVLGSYLFVIFIIVFIFNLFTRRSQKINWLGFFVIFWLGISHLIFNIMINQVTEGYGTFAWALPPLFLLAVAPCKNKQTTPLKLNLKPFSWFAILFSLTAFFLIGRNIRSHYYKATHPNLGHYERQKTFSKIGVLLSSQKDNTIWNAYFDEISWIPTMESFYRSGKWIMPAGQDYFFSKHVSVWKGNYPHLSSQEMAISSFKNTSKWVHLALVFQSPDSALSHFKNKHSKAVAYYYSTHMPNDPQWKKITSISTERYGMIDAYKNLNIQDSTGFTKLMHNIPLRLPTFEN